MPRIIVAVIVSLVIGAAIGAWLPGDAPPDDESSTSIDERLARLERVVAEERNARIVLEDQLQALVADFERLGPAGPAASAEQQAALEQPSGERRNPARVRRDFLSMVSNFQERRLNMLVDGGYSEDEAQRVLRRESEAQYKALQAAYDARRRGEPTDAFAAINGSQTLLRAELGDSEYERYLEAQGQPTSIQVTQVLDGSPGSEAGLQPGDKIVSYNGERVFSVSDLRALTLEGRAGEDVVVDIERDGVRMQMNLPRGPVGITGSSANIRNMNWWGGS